jgi:hypothetical protein
MQGENSIPPKPGFRSAANDYIEIDLRKRADGNFIKAPAWASHTSKLRRWAALICGAALIAFITWRFAGTRPAFLNSDLAADTAQAPAAWSARMFYLSKNAVPGGGAPAACSAGFHMASIYEVLNVSTLRYDTTLGLASADSGQGPPGLSFGWIRTGLVGDPPHTCNGWTSSSPVAAYQGFAIRLNALAGSPAPAFGLQPWEFLGYGDRSNSANCDTRHNVWCVQD